MRVVKKVLSFSQKEEHIFIVTTYYHFLYN